MRGDDTVSSAGVSTSRRSLQLRLKDSTMDEKRRSLFTFVASGTLGVIFLIGLIFQSVFLTRPGPVYIFPFFLDVWLCIFGVFFSLQAIYLEFKTFSGAYDWKLDLFYYGFEALVALLLMVGSFASYRWDGGLCAILVIVILALDLFIIVSKRPLSTKLYPIGTPSQRQHARHGRRCLSCFNTFLRVVAFILFGLMLGGTFVQAVGYQTYPPRGKFITITYPSGLQQDILVWCTGPINKTLPVFFFEIGGGGHSMSDLWGLQFALNDQGRRVCSYDFPGTGWSGHGVPKDQQTKVTERVISAMVQPGVYPEDTGPYIFYGTMDDAPARMYEYALDHPLNVKALIPVQYNVVPELLPEKIVRDWTDEQAIQNAKAVYSGRELFGLVIRALGVQWGLMPVFAPVSNKYIPQDMAMEHAFLNSWNAKQWTTNTMYLSQLLTDPSQAFAPDLWLANRSLNADIPVYVIQDKIQNVTETCIQRRLALDSVNCEILRVQNAMTNDGLIAMTNMTAGSSITRCERETCHGFFAFYYSDNMNWTVSTILDLVGEISLP